MLASYLVPITVLEVTKFRHILVLEIGKESLTWKGRLLFDSTLAMHLLLLLGKFHYVGTVAKKFWLNLLLEITSL